MRRIIRVPTVHLYHNDTQDIATCRSSRLVVPMLAGLQWGSITLMTTCKHLSAVDKFAFTGEAARSHIYLLNTGTH